MMLNREDVQEGMIPNEATIAPLYQSQIENAKKRELEIISENNRHLEKINQIHVGWIGCLLGNNVHVATSVAFIVIIVCFISYSLIPEERSSLLSVITTALAYIFGQSSHSK